MPKEIIKRANYLYPAHTVDEPWPESNKVTGDHLAIHWGREVESAQLHYIRYDDDSQKSIDAFIDLGRREINSLIKFLRTARDQSFGRDE
jgi:hypothetical protein